MNQPFGYFGDAGGPVSGAIAATSAAREMPQYQCHKKVHALKIKAMDFEHLGKVLITPEEPGYTPFFVSDAYVMKHTPKRGGYYVVYEDGYASFSPAEAFESGYTQL
jgi:hypothetical protein